MTFVFHPNEGGFIIPGMLFLSFFPVLLLIASPRKELQFWSTWWTSTVTWNITWPTFSNLIRLTSNVLRLQYNRMRLGWSRWTWAKKYVISSVNVFIHIGNNKNWNFAFRGLKFCEHYHYHLIRYCSRGDINFDKHIYLWTGVWPLIIN